MRAKTINEIVRGKSGLGSLGIGHHSMFKGYNEIKKLVPQFEKDTYPIKGNPMADEIEIAIVKASTTLNCTTNDLMLLKDSLGLDKEKIRKFISDTVLGSSNMFSDDIIVGAGRIQRKNGAFDDYHVLTSKYWQVAKIVLTTNSIKEYYLIRYN